MTNAQAITAVELRRPHSDVQREMIEYPGNVAALCGRRFGKTEAMTQRIFYHMARRPGLYWWVGLSWRSASLKRAWREVNAITRRTLAAIGEQERGNVNRSKYEVRIPGLGEIWFRTAESPESLAGEGIQGAVLDEYTLMAEIVWTEYVEATLLDYDGWAAFTGVPKGENWASTLWRSAAERDGWLQIAATTYDNPYIPKARIDAIRQNTTADLFRQEYMAQIVADAGSVFRGVAEATLSDGKPYDTGTTVLGVDIADANDYTAIVGLSTARDLPDKMVYFDRFRRVGYDALEQRILAAISKTNAVTAVVEANGVGEPEVQRLNALGAAVVPFTTTNVTKHHIVTALASAFEHKNILIEPNDTLVTELQSFTAKRSVSGGYTYSAPPGLHDDTVMALAFAKHATAKAGSLILF